jgi:hypothetical protein
MIFHGISENKQMNKKIKSWWCSSVVEHLPSMCNPLYSILSNKTKPKNLTPPPSNPSLCGLHLELCLQLDMPFFTEPLKTGIFNGNTRGKRFVYLFIYILAMFLCGSYYHPHVTNEESRHDKIIYLPVSYSYSPSLNTNLDNFHP